MKKMILLRFLLIMAFVGWSASVYGQGVFTSAATGNWNDPASWTFTGTDADGIPDSDDNVTIGHAIAVPDATASCNNLVFTTGGSINFNSATSVLSINGNSTFGADITNISGWTSGAKLVFTGTAAQTLTTGANTRFDAIEINKASGTITQTPSAAVVRIQSSISVISGTFTLGAGTDIEGVQFANGTTATTPTLTVGLNGVLNINSGASFIRTGTTGTGPIGTVTINGTANLGTTSGNGFQFGAVTVGDGSNAATLTMTSVFNSSGLFNFSSLTVNANSTFIMNASSIAASTITGIF